LWEQAKHPGTGEPLTSATIIVGAANNWMNRFHDRQPIILGWRDANAWMRGDDPGAFLRSPPEDSLKEWIVSTRVNKAGIGDDDTSLVDPVEDLVP
jgi:putative SOS response-associated peptidase YedK